MPRFQSIILSQTGFKAKQKLVFGDKYIFGNYVEFHFVPSQILAFSAEGWTEDREKGDFQCDPLQL